MIPSLTFHGAAATVTGSCHLLSLSGGRVLIDCGMFQGAKTVRELNYRPFPFDPAGIDAVLLTHAHIDHSGLIPKLVKAGFRGPVFATAATVDLARVMLPDSGYIQEFEVERLNRRNARRGRPPVEPIYGKADAEAALSAFRAVAYDAWTDILPGLRARFWNAGHILGSASIELEYEDAAARRKRTRMLFSGDIGPDNKLLHPDPEGPSDLDVLVMEATYGDRDRARLNPAERRAVLAGEVDRALARGGPLLIPSFAVERTQELLSDLIGLMRAGTIPRMAVFLDSPLAIRATEIFARHADVLEDGVDASAWRETGLLRFAETQEESRAIDRLRERFIVLAASGMCEAGRIRHHLRNFLWRREATVLLTGYQAQGSLGAALLGGEPAVRIHGQEIAVHAAIRSIDAYSGHADAAELTAWAMARRPVRRAVYLTHGEPLALDGLRARLIAAGMEAGRVHVPGLDETVTLTGHLRRKAAETPRLEPTEAPGAEDWRNEYARLALALQNRVAALPDARARARAIAALRRTLDKVT